jgi:adenine/guanine phosphoribosyltransferase-like PRPP-binding protein
MPENHKTNGDRHDAEQVFDLIELPPKEVEAAWQAFVMTHIRPGRLLRLATGLESPEDSERHHLEWCKSCLRAYQRYATPSNPVTTDRNPRFFEDQSGNLRQIELWPADTTHQFCDLHAIANSREDRNYSPVPPSLKAHLHIPGPIVFGGNEVAFESWQFGHLLSGDGDFLRMEPLVETIVEVAAETLQSWSTSRNVLLVCFGRAMHRCGVRIAVRIGEETTTHPHVVLAHDYYSPTVVCNDKEFVDADVIVLTDVVHSGATLDGLLALCVSRGARRVRGLTLVDQSGGMPLCAEWHSLWQEPKEQRIALSVFVQQASEEQIRQLRRFEPNDEVALSPRSSNSFNLSPVRTSRLTLDDELARHIHDTGALKRDYMIGQKRYPYVVNVLDLIKKSTAAKTFVLERAAATLIDLKDKHIALAYHAGRKRRAGRIADLFHTVFGWPVIAIGSTGPIFTVSDAQLRRLAGYDTVVVVDAALRTGDTISAMVRAIDDTLLLKHTQFVALCVLNALADKLRQDLASSLGIEIRALFDLPLPPPTEQVRHWANLQKAIIRSRMASSGAFTSIEHVLAGYCAPGKRGAHSRPTITKTRELIESAIQAAEAISHGSHRIEAACMGSKPQFIRHLPVNEVVHDRNVQEMLIGVMFNSAKAGLKESAAFALAAARNYEWMTLDWLKLNRPFIASASHAWKSIVMVECEMKMSGRHRELNRFRDASIELREQVASCKSAHARNSTQLPLPNMEPSAAAIRYDRAIDSTNELLIERLDTFVAAAE